MKIEHFAFNVEDPLQVVSWYVEHLGMTVTKAEKEPPYMHFLADSSGNVMIEIYNNPADQVPNYTEMDPLILHLAFVSKNPGEDKSRLLQAGASLEDDETLPDGSRVIMLRDPWGFPVQLCKRAKPMI